MMRSIFSDWSEVIAARPGLRELVPIYNELIRLRDLGERCPTGALADMLAAALAGLETGGPRASFGDMADDARFWADIASPRELEVYFTAICTRLMRGRYFAPAARKRLLVYLWGTLSEADRHAFLSKVDPEGDFAGRVE